MDLSGCKTPADLMHPDTHMFEVCRVIPADFKAVTGSLHNHVRTLHSCVIDLLTQPLLLVTATQDLLVL